MLRREVPILLTMIVGWFMVAEFFLPWAEPGASQVQQFAVILTACASVLGVANVVRLNLRKVSRRERDWGYAILLLGGLGVMLLLGTALPVVRSLFGIDAPWTLGGHRLAGVTDGSLFNQLYDRTFVPLSSTMFALLAFYVASAAFRAFRVRTLEAALLAAAAILVMLGRVPVGDKLWSGLPLLTDWVMNVPQLAAKRAILIGAALGAVSTGLKILLGIERNFLGSD